MNPDKEFLKSEMLKSLDRAIDRIGELSDIIRTGKIDLLADEILLGFGFRILEISVSVDRADSFMQPHKGT